MSWAFSISYYGPALLNKSPNKAAGTLISPVPLQCVTPNLKAPGMRPTITQMQLRRSVRLGLGAP
jgi:hypothetical protein